MTACSSGGKTWNTSGTGGQASSDSEAEAELPPEYEDGYEITGTDFSITTDVENGYSVENGVYTIVAAGVYTCTGSLADGQIVVDAGDDDVVEIELKTVEIACSFGAPILLLNADKVEISAKKDTKNIIIDSRTTCEDTDETAAAIYSKCDLKLKGNGTLSVKSTLNNGVHSKDDLDIKNLTLYVYAPNNAVKGNDSITCENATVTAISTGGDAFKTTNSDISSKDNQRGTVTIDGGKLDLYACCDGIDAAYDVVISNNAEITINTNTYSSYTSERVETSASSMYFRFTSGGSGGPVRPGQSSFNYASYQYSVLFTLSDGGTVWENLTSSKSAGSYVYYEVDLPANADKFCLYAYSSSQSQQNTSDYAYYSGDKNINTAFDTFGISGVSGGKLTGEWTNYSTTTQQAPGNNWGGGFGQEGNPNSAEFSCKGIKSGNEITINDCTIVINAYDDAIHANNENLLENGNYGAGNVTICAGVLTLTTKDDGIHADQDLIASGGTVTVEGDDVYEGLEANRLYLCGATVHVYATDDAVNASASGNYTPLAEISAGYVDLEAPSGDTDTLDSNGNIKITGGVIVLKNGQSGQSNTGGNIDCDGSITVTGGTVIAIGAAGHTISGAKSNTSTSFSAGDYVFQDANGNTVAEFTLSSSHKGYMIYADSGTYTLSCGSTSVVSLSF